mmetsp:Transcript_23518/g.65277  ORF Transcript_23518/g.65277 Transcript_23518/m.65277 type:complete len:87 (+) Transcript_23518:1901-2161(+)
MRLTRNIAIHAYCMSFLAGSLFHESIINPETIQWISRIGQDIKPRYTSKSWEFLLFLSSVPPIAHFITNFRKKFNLPKQSIHEIVM